MTELAWDCKNYRLWDSTTVGAKARSDDVCTCQYTHYTSATVITGELNFSVLGNLFSIQTLCSKRMKDNSDTNSSEQVELLRSRETRSLAICKSGGLRVWLFSPHQKGSHTPISWKRIGHFVSFSGFLTGNGWVVFRPLVTNECFYSCLV